MTAHLTEKELVELKDAFAIFDKNNDGFIKKAEVKDILISLGKDGSDREVERVIKQVDADGDGVINFTEFINLMAGDCTDGVMESANALEHMFKMFDRDGDGYITRSELKRVLGEMGGAPVTRSEVDEMLNEADNDGDQKISYDEFVAVMKEKYPNQYQHH